MPDISGQLIKDSYSYILQADISTGYVYRVNGNVPVNPIFSSGLSIFSAFTFVDGSQQNGYVLTSDANGNASWKPVSGATPSSGVTSINVLPPLSANSTTGVVTISFTGTSLTGDYLPLSGGTVTGGTEFTDGFTANTIQTTGDLYVGKTGFGAGILINDGGTGNGRIQAGNITLTNRTLDLPDADGTFIITINNNGPDTSGNIDVVLTGDYLPLSGGTVTGGTIFQSGLTANTISATTYENLPTYISAVTLSSDNVLSVTTGGTSGVTTTINSVTGGTYANGTIILSGTGNVNGTLITGFPTATGTTTNYYGSFSDTTNQPVNGANTPTVWSANTTEISNGIYIQDGSKIKVSNSGIYEIGYSAQIEKTSSGGKPNVTIWAAINGSAVTRSSSTITFDNQSSYQLPFVSYIFDLNANDYVEFYFSSPDSGIRLTTLSGLTTPTRPVSPSLIIVAKAIGNAVLNTSGDSFVTGFTLTNDNLILTQNRVGQYSGFTVNLPYLNTTGGTISGNLNVTGSVSATTFYGNGGNLTGISRGGGGGAGGQLYYFNISNTQTPYYEWSLSATSAAEQTISATTGASETAFVGGFMTPPGVPNVTNIPAGIMSFYLHCYDGNNHNFNIYCELYIRTTGGTETLLFTSDPVPVVGNVVEMVITDGFFSGATIDVTDRMLVKIYANNISNQTRTIYFVSEGSQHYSFSLTTLPSFVDTYVTGFTYSNNTFTIKQNNNQTDLSQTINTVTGWTVNGNLSVTGTTSTDTISATTYQNLPTYVSATTLSAANVLSVTTGGGSPTTTTINAATGGTYSSGTITLAGSGALSNIAGLPQGTVQSVTAGTGMNFTTITSSGGINIDTTKVPYYSGGFSNGLAKYNGSSWVFDSSTYLTSAVTAATLSAANVLSVTSTNGSPATSTVNAVTGGTYNSTTGIITLSGTGNVNGTQITGITSSGGGLTWNNSTTTQSASVNNGYVGTASTLTTITLPTSAAFGSTIEVVGTGTGLWRISQNASQSIKFGVATTTTGTGGYLSATSQYDCVKLLCTSADTTFVVSSSVGNIFFI